MKKLARIEMEVSYPEHCPHAKVYSEYPSGVTDHIECVYPYVRTCIPPGIDLGNKLSCKWFEGNDQLCPLDDVTP